MVSQSPNRSQRPGKQSANKDFSGAIGLAAGGTGGHVLAAAAVAQKLKADNVSCVLFTDRRGMKWRDACDDWQVECLAAASPYASVSSANGFVRLLSRVVAVARSALTNYLAVNRARRVLRRRKVRAMIGFGGYPAFPGCLAAHLNDTALIIHEQNSVMGRANGALARCADVISRGLPEARHKPAADNSSPPSSRNSLVVGNPVRQSVVDNITAYQPPVAGGEFRLLVFGGSQGAAGMVELLIAALARVSSENRQRIKLQLQCGLPQVEAARASLAAMGVDATVAEFYQDLPARMSGAHLVVARGGASTVSELAVMGRPSIIMPLPGALDGDQQHNAAWLAARHAASVLHEREHTPAYFATLLEDLAGDPARLANMAAAASGAMTTDAAGALARHALQLAQQQRRGNRLRWLMPYRFTAPRMALLLLVASLRKA